MSSTSRRGGALACALLATTALASPALAQSAPPRHSAIDENGVDLTSGWIGWSMTEGTIGSGEGAVTLTRTWAGTGGWTDNWSGKAYQRTSGGVSEMVVEFGGISDRFSISGGSFTSQKADGATLTGGSGAYTYTAADGTVIDYVGVGIDLGYPMQGIGCSLADAGTCAVPVTITRPNGMRFTLSWDVLERSGAAYFRLAGVSSGANYGFTLSYATNTPGGSSGPPQSNWYKKTGATFSNAASSPPTAPTVSYTYTSTTLTGVTDTGGRSWTFGFASNGHLSSVQRPGTSAATSSWSYGSNGVSSATIEGVTTGYSVSVSGSTRTTTVTNALSQATSVVADTSKGRITSVTDPLSRTTGFQYDTSGRLTRTTLPEGNYVNLSYDGRGNVTETRAVAKSGSGLSDIVATASFDSSCSNPAKCNKPNSITDARGYTTDYTYDTTHGGLLTATAPAAPSGTRPQTRYSYSQVTAVTGQPVYLLTGISACQSSSSCSGGSDEAKTTISYNTSNLLPTGTSSGNGSGTLTASSAMSYDSYGNLISVDGPLSGSADTIAFKYNSARERLGEISPDPDGSGSLKHRATRRTIDSQGLVTKVEAGTVLSQSDGDWANFSAIQAVETSYDGYARPTVRKTTAGGTTYALTQTGYDALGRVECVATRMNGGAWSSLPSSACSLCTEGSFGPDRIVKKVYDSAGQVTQVKSAVGTSLEAADVTSTYRSNGQAETVTDGEGNKTTYEFDGHDRLVKTRFPSTTQGAGTSSTTDYEQYGYDAGGNRTSFRNRGGDTIAFTFDANGRMTAKDLPGSEPDVSYAHDLLGRMTSASQSGNSLSFTYDALGRQLTQGGPQGTYTSAFDLAGRRTRLTHPDSNYFDYDWLVSGDISKIRENGATSGVGVLATYNYDTSTNAGQMGQVTSISFGNGMSRSFSYDAVLRLTSLGHDLSGTTYDQTLGFSYNPASQITQNTRSNDLYAWGGHYNVNRSYTSNGLNQYTASGSVTPTYDSKGNLTSAGSTTYTYSSENLLKTATGGITLAYDPAMRLYETVGSTTTRFAYDGADLVAEHNSSNTLQRRFVHGPGVDDPIVWYEGSGTTDRRFLQTDERGSVTTVTNSSAGVIATNAYDEYGIPASTNLGRFQYTGQTWLPELGMYYYKARIYSPTLGRFLQTDPIGYGDGMNMYAYVSGDPVNRGDPSGQSSCGPGNRAPTPEEAKKCGAAQAAMYQNYNPGPSFDDFYMAAVTMGQVESFEAGKNIDGFYSMYADDYAAQRSLDGVDSDARQASRSRCRGEFQCESTPDAEMARNIRALIRNPVFKRAYFAIFKKSKTTGNEWGFTGKGFEDFQLVGGLIEGSKDRIDAGIIASRALQGANVFFHTHPNLGRRYEPYLSHGVQSMLLGGDLGVAYRNNMFIGALGFKTRTNYWFDGRNLKR